MIAVDTNILVYSHRRDSPFFDRARAAVSELAEDGRAWSIPWPVLAEFYAVTTNRKLFDTPSTPEQAVDQIDIWIDAPGVSVLGETSATWAVLRGFLLAGQVSGSLVYDARIAAICLSHGVRELWTSDRDYGRFPSLRTRNPLIGAR